MAMAMAMMAQLADAQNFAHDPAQCRENGAYDSDCCGLNIETSCADGFIKHELETTCIVNTPYVNYQCIENGASPMQGLMIPDRDIAPIARIIYSLPTHIQWVHATQQE